MNEETSITRCVCGQELEATFQACPSCGRSTSTDSLACPGCAKQVKSKWKICPYCKATLSGWSTPTSGGTAGGVSGGADTPEVAASSNVSQMFVSQVDEGSSAPRPGPGADLSIATGDVLADRYTVHRALGTGGFGAVYLVEDSELGEKRALKVVVVGKGKAERAREQMLHEFKLRERINDATHIVRSQDPRSCEYKGLSLVLLPMELADGGSLRQWLRGNGDVEKRRQAGLDLFRQACHGVKAIHDAGLAHLDIKPENILLVNGKAKVTDFGIGRYVDGQFADNPDQLLRQGVGTPQYMSPEQFRTARQAEIGPPSDIYSLGLLLYELLDGSLPFDGSPQELREKHLNVQPPALKAGAAQWWPVVERCLAKDPERRYPGVEQLLRDVNRAAEGAALSTDVACHKCGHVNAKRTSEFCEECGSKLTGLFRECPHCGRRNRLDVENCEGCGFRIAAHYLFQQRKMKAEKLKDEEPAEAIGLLELMLRDGASEEEAMLIKELRQKQSKIGPWITQAGEKALAGQPDEAIELWRKVLEEIPRHRTAQAEIEKLEALLAEFNSRRDQATDSMDRAQFDEADKFLQACLELIPQRQDVRQLLNQSRERAKGYAALSKEASSAQKNRMLREAFDRVEEMFSLAPESPEALYLKVELSESIGETDRLIVEARSHLARAEFTQVEENIREVEERQADQADVQEVKETLARTREAYGQAVSEAEQARRDRDLDKAAKAIKRASDLCPDCPKVSELSNSVKGEQQEAQDLLNAAGRSISGACFEDGERQLKLTEETWPQVKGLTDARQRLATTRTEYDQHMKRAREGKAKRELPAALEAAQQALALCPDSEAPRKLAGEVEKDQNTARSHLGSAKKLRKAAEFDEATNKVALARELWPTLAGLDGLEAEIASTRKVYRQEIDATRGFLKKKQIRDAFAACERALEICPQSTEAKSLEREIGGAEDEEERRQRAQERKSKERRAGAKRVARRTTILVAVLGGLAVLGVGGLFLWRWIQATAWPWCLDHTIILIGIDVVLLILTSLVHKARFTNLYRNILVEMFNARLDMQLVAVGMIALLLTLLCGGPAAGIGWLTAKYLAVTGGQATTIGLLVGGVLVIVALVHSMFCYCKWRRVD